MDDEEYYRLKSFLDRSKNRRKILELLSERNEAMRPTDIASEIGIKRNNVSTRISDLLEEDLVEILNPEDNRNRYYRITDRGEELLSQR